MYKSANNSPNFITVLSQDGALTRPDFQLVLPAIWGGFSICALGRAYIGAPPNLESCTGSLRRPAWLRYDSHHRPSHLDHFYRSMVHHPNQHRTRLNLRLLILARSRPLSPAARRSLCLSSSQGKKEDPPYPCLCGPVPRLDRTVLG